MKANARFSDGFEVIRLRSMRHGKTEHEEIVWIDDSTKKYIQNNKIKFQRLLESLDNETSRLALLADLVDEFLDKKIESKKKDFKSDIEAINE
ncbi:hypothetical protein GF1_16040 [Desulfolithobacter dissulfuricans]|uniref:Uncharacterized protein n=1 Tax=Desulfolithobacter dissulfuricans TaxID=2795293 RepID=A0A915U0I5_9BACT|nr:hypothetical protein [Desulfolithobacter dissulfuricans]BCO09228.1 hypothetical protein GF1_16040 [Desulfolithobacter dissulfuricans]